MYTLPLGGPSEAIVSDQTTSTTSATSLSALSVNNHNYSSSTSGGGGGLGARYGDRYGDRAAYYGDSSSSISSLASPKSPIVPSVNYRQQQQQQLQLQQQHQHQQQLQLQQQHQHWTSARGQEGIVSRSFGGPSKRTADTPIDTHVTVATATATATTTTSTATSGGKDTMSDHKSESSKSRSGERSRSSDGSRRSSRSNGSRHSNTSNSHGNSHGHSNNSNNSRGSKQLTLSDSESSSSSSGAGGGGSMPFDGSGVSSSENRDLAASLKDLENSLLRGRAPRHGKSTAVHPAAFLRHQESESGSGSVDAGSVPRRRRSNLASGHPHSTGSPSSNNDGRPYTSSASPGVATTDSDLARGELVEADTTRASQQHQQQQRDPLDSSNSVATDDPPATRKHHRRRKRNGESHTTGSSVSASAQPGGDDHHPHNSPPKSPLQQLSAESRRTRSDSHSRSGASESGSSHRSPFGRHRGMSDSAGGAEIDVIGGRGSGGGASLGIATNHNSTAAPDTATNNHTNTNNTSFAYTGEVPLQPRNAGSGPPGITPSFAPLQLRRLDPQALPPAAGFACPGELDTSVPEASASLSSTLNTSLNTSLNSTVDTLEASQAIDRALSSKMSGRRRHKHHQLSARNRSGSFTSRSRSGSRTPPPLRGGGGGVAWPQAANNNSTVNSNSGNNCGTNSGGGSPAKTTGALSGGSGGGSVRASDLSSTTTSSALASTQTSSTLRSSFNSADDRALAMSSPHFSGSAPALGVSNTSYDSRGRSGSGSPQPPPSSISMLAVSPLPNIGEGVPVTNHTAVPLLTHTLAPPTLSRQSSTESGLGSEGGGGTGVGGGGGGESSSGTLSITSTPKRRRRRRPSAIDVSPTMSRHRNSEGGSAGYRASLGGVASSTPEPQPLVTMSVPSDAVVMRAGLVDHIVGMGYARMYVVDTIYQLSKAQALDSEFPPPEAIVRKMKSMYPDC